MSRSIQPVIASKFELQIWNPSFVPRHPGLVRPGHTHCRRARRKQPGDEMVCRQLDPMAALRANGSRNLGFHRTSATTGSEIGSRMQEIGTSPETVIGAPPSHFGLAMTTKRYVLGCTAKDFEVLLF